MHLRLSVKPSPTQLLFLFYLTALRYSIITVTHSMVLGLLSKDFSALLLQVADRVTGPGWVQHPSSTVRVLSCRVVVTHTLEQSLPQAQMPLPSCRMVPSEVTVTRVCIKPAQGEYGVTEKPGFEPSDPVESEA